MKFTVIPLVLMSSTLVSLLPGRSCRSINCCCDCDTNLAPSTDKLATESSKVDCVSEKEEPAAAPPTAAPSVEPSYGQRSAFSQMYMNTIHRAILNENEGQHHDENRVPFWEKLAASHDEAHERITQQNPDDGKPVFGKRSPFNHFMTHVTKYAIAGEKIGYNDEDLGRTVDLNFVSSVLSPGRQQQNFHRPEQPMGARQQQTWNNGRQQTLNSGRQQTPRSGIQQLVRSDQQQAPNDGRQQVTNSNQQQRSSNWLQPSGDQQQQYSGGRPRQQLYAERQPYDEHSVNNRPNTTPFVVVNGTPVAVGQSTVDQLARFLPFGQYE